MTRGLQVLLGAAFVLHGLAHALPGMRALDRLAGWPVGAPEVGSLALVAVGTGIWAISMVGFVAAGFGAWGVRPLVGHWPRLAAAGALASILLLGLFRPEHALPGIMLSMGAILFLWKRWKASSSVAAAPSTHRPGAGRRLISVVAVLFLLYLALAIIARPWHMRWGSTDAELALTLPGDELVEGPLRYGIQHAVTIRAPADEVWPWLVQIGQDRAGFYSYDGLERLFGARIHNVEHIVPEWQALSPGDSVFATQPGYLGIVKQRLGWRVARVDPGRALVLEKWGAFVLEPAEPGGTRLLVRSRGGGTGSILDVVLGPAGLLIFEIPHFIMERRMLLGIRDLAEAHREGGPSPAAPTRPSSSSSGGSDPRPS
ncbi:MAG: hypothetical protein EA350_11595 [Gemmatimonadales bacterium]|nr:MAG: hypothetical protein EA350_11595 [Gemmatimonadales bacterium]